MKKNKNAFSLVIVMWIVLVTSLLALTLLELILPFSRSVVWIENASRAYYLANSWLEQKLLDLKKNEKKNNEDLKSYDVNFSNITDLGNSDWIKTKFINKWKKEPLDLKWDYQNDWKNYNTISPWNPIQIDISGINNISQLQITFLIPNFWINLSLEPSKKYISWQFSSEHWYLESGEENAISWNEIEDVLSVVSLFKNISNFKWTNWNTIWDTYNTWWCSNSSKKCILKFTIINDLKGIPYLLWELNNNNDFFLRYSYLESEWIFRWYTRKLEIKVPKETVNEAFDFAVFQ